ncbi:hypothetical protein [Paraburkholderia tropica]|uniref:hypothetical protein n=1 Tax=Paraburkholderia tropica TaxID=92647 RepID=UPI001619C614|nr:hypothetical protein [Paraburkholderia tropica]MBB6317320.1 hypothetical protein [Paraburkholderia tropica]
MTDTSFVNFRRRPAKVTTSARKSKTNFQTAISDLRQRASKARRARTTIASAVIILVVSAAALVFLRFTQSNNRTLMNFGDIAVSLVRNADYSPRQVFLRRIDNALNPVYPDPLFAIAKRLDTGKEIEAPKLSPADISGRMNDANQLLSMYERAEKAEAMEKPQPSRAEFAPIVSTLAFSAGAVAFVILAIQIAVMFMRYYAQLAELYDGQAAALEASNGDVGVAIRFMESFSPNAVILGKSPTTLYEKSLDIISNLAKSKFR